MLDLTADVIDVRNIITTIEKLREDETHDKVLLTQLIFIMESLKGTGDDEKWEGSWYPVTLIAEHYFTEYNKEMLIDCGYISIDFPSSFIVIDWQATAENCLADYTEIMINNNTYYIR